ncbi:MAG TPA: hypothetical protein VFB41_04000 [Solirubrobacteraceae bacterium]|nr:hypothetical protein [Solirubrobacteraceae bacterium]
MQTKLLWFAVLLSAGAIAGCGDKASLTSGDTAQDKVTAVIDDLGTSARDGDGDRICKELFTSNLRISVARASGTTCAKEVGANIFSSDTKFDIGDVTVDGTTATASVTDQDGRTSSLVFASEDGQWRIARIG